MARPDAVLWGQNANELQLITSCAISVVYGLPRGGQSIYISSPDRAWDKDEGARSHELDRELQTGLPSQFGGAVMNAKFALTLLTRAEAARKRVAALETRATRSPKEADSLKIALHELDVALEEVRVAADQLHAAMDDLKQARRVASDFEERYRELHERLPLPCVLTNELGCVDEANGSAASLLNVAPRFLSGKPLLLFFPEREQYFELIESVRSSGIGNARLTVRPRDRKPKQVSIDVSTMPQQVRWCWVFSEVA